MQAARHLFMKRVFINLLENRFRALHERSIQIIGLTPARLLYAHPRELPKTFAMFSIGEYILRSAAAVEQTFNGITTRLWDDPFEWTLPEKLQTPNNVVEYLGEVESAVKRGFQFIASDEMLEKQLPAPEELRTIFEILVSTLSRADHFQGRAFAIFQMLSDENLPKL